MEQQLLELYLVLVLVLVVNQCSNNATQYMQHVHLTQLTIK